ncbi:hypothetical protein D3C80_2210540 [compost metagenome]
MDNEIEPIQARYGVRLCFNLQSQEELGKLLDCHRITAQNFTETFLDTDDIF